MWLSHLAFANLKRTYPWMCLLLSSTPAWAPQPPRWLCSWHPRPLLTCLDRAAAVTLKECKPDRVNPPTASCCHWDKKLLNVGHLFLPRPAPLCPQPQCAAPQGQASVRQAAPLQDALPGILSSSPTPTWLIHPLIFASVVFLPSRFT